MNTSTRLRRRLRVAAAAAAALGIVAATAGAANALTLSQTSSNAVVAGNSASCALSGTQEFTRVFDVQAEEGVTTPFNLTSVSFGVESVQTGQVDDLTASVNVYETNRPGSLAQPFYSQGLPLLASHEVTLTNADSGTLVTVPMTATLSDPVNKLLVVTVAPVTRGDEFESSFTIGSNGDPESKPGYVVLPACGVNTPTSAESVKAGMHIVLFADGQAEAPPPAPTRVVSGFSQPVDQSVRNKAQAGSTVPFKFTVTDGDGKPVTDLTSGDVTTLMGPLGSCSGQGGDPIEETVAGALGGKLINQGGGHYQYNWKTDKAWKGKCVTLGIQVADAEPQKARFNFAK